MYTKLYQLFRKRPATVSVFFAVVYTISFFLIDNFNREPVIYIHSAVDDYIPFWRFAVIPYIFWAFYMLLPALVLYFVKDHEDLWNMLFPMFICMFGSLAIYLILPSGLHLRPESIPGNDLCSRLVRLIESNDSPTNVCPSIHAATTVVVDLALQECRLLKARTKQNHALRVMIRLMDLAILASTLLIKQHSIYDIILGIGFALIVTLVYRRKYVEAQYRLPALLIRA